MHNVCARCESYVSFVLAVVLLDVSVRIPCDAPCAFLLSVLYALRMFVVCVALYHFFACVCWTFCFYTYSAYAHGVCSHVLRIVFCFCSCYTLYVCVCGVYCVSRACFVCIITFCACASSMCWSHVRIPPPPSLLCYAQSVHVCGVYVALRRYHGTVFF